MANPAQFIRFRLKVLGKGIKAVIGFKKGGGSEVQSFLFPKSQYTLAKAKAWIKEHKYHVSETEAYWVTSIDIDPETKDLILEETLAKDEDEEDSGVDVHEMSEDVFRWLVK